MDIRPDLDIVVTEELLASLTADWQHRLHTLLEYVRKQPSGSTQVNTALDECVYIFMTLLKEVYRKNSWLKTATVTEYPVRTCAVDILNGWVAKDATLVRDAAFVLFKNRLVESVGLLDSLAVEADPRKRKAVRTELIRRRLLVY